MNKIVALSLFAVLASVTSAQTRSWYRGPVGPLKADPVPPSCSMPPGGKFEDWKCDQGLRITSIGVYGDWRCVALEVKSGESWVLAEKSTPACYNEKPRQEEPKPEEK